MNSAEHPHVVLFVCLYIQALPDGGPIRTQFLRVDDRHSEYFHRARPRVYNIFSPFPKHPPHKKKKTHFFYPLVPGPTQNPPPPPPPPLTTKKKRGGGKG